MRRSPFPPCPIFAARASAARTCVTFNFHPQAGAVSSPSALPDVSVVIATRDREELLTRSLSAVMAQTYPGRVDVVVVYDQAPPRSEHEHASSRRGIRVVTNTRTPGLAGARNTGLGEARGELVAFCDDDDLWRPPKLERQVEQLGRTGAGACVTGIAVHYGDREVERIPDADLITPDLLVGSRLTGAHPSSYVMTAATVAAVGHVDEDLPGGYGEDYDWLLRLAQHTPVTVVREPLVDVLWHRGSFFTSRWDSMIDSVDYLLGKHPSLQADRRGLARLRGQQAFALAALGRRRQALRSCWQIARTSPGERRAYVAALVASGVLRADWVMDQANRRGRGI